MRNAIVAIQRLGVVSEYDIFHNRKIVAGYPLQEYAGELLQKLLIQRAGLEEYVASVQKGLFSNAWVDEILQSHNCLVKDYHNRPLCKSSRKAS